MTEHVKGVPGGSYCYGVVPSPKSGFATNEQIHKHLTEKYAGDLDSTEAFLEYLELTVPKHCRYWAPTEHGFVECTFLHERAIFIGDDEENRRKACVFFGSEEEVDRQVTSWLLGDGVKACQINRDLPDFEIS